MSHKTKDCLERPRSKGARWTDKHIAADEKVEDIQLKTYEARRDRWNGYDASEYSRVVDMCAPRLLPCGAGCWGAGSQVDQPLRAS